MLLLVCLVIIMVVVMMVIRVEAESECMVFVFELNSNRMRNPLHHHLPSFPKKLSTEAPLLTQMAKKADAWKEYEEAALVDMMLKVV